jgi:hypothetical protein
MLRHISRAGRRPLALTLATLGVTLAALGGLTACADAPLATAPGAPNKPDLAAGDVYTVTTTNDAGVGSLRWALSWTTGGETIRFDPSLAGQTITLDSMITTRKPTTIEGPAGKGVIISGGFRTRHFQLSHTGTLRLRNLTLRDGKAPGNESGGSMLGYGAVVIENSAVYGNEASGSGAIFAGNLTLVNTTVSGNKSTATYPEAVVSSGGALQVINSTVANNSGGGTSGHAVTLRNSIIANNGPGRNCYGMSGAVYEGVNLSNDDTCGGPADMLIADPKLAPLADNGGPGMTHALLAGSPAINAGTSCSLSVDERYVARDAQCDLGAFEFIDFTTVTLTIDPSAAVNQSNGWAVVTGTVKCSRNETFSLAVELDQAQKVGRALTDVHAATTVPIACGTSVRPWSAPMVLTSGAFRTGAAQAKVMTIDAPAWVAPAGASGGVKLYWGRK